VYIALAFCQGDVLSVRHLVGAPIKITGRFFEEGIYEYGCSCNFEIVSFYSVLSVPRFH
jgi:hypothetical protein